MCTPDGVMNRLSDTHAGPHALARAAGERFPGPHIRGRRGAAPVQLGRNDA
ncbi:hypothetical protein SALB1_1171 [Salinisphaera sp. LB1]|nr:hypothetical protein SALB1_1171 [Salinisphaera sp. LB1]